MKLKYQKKKNMGIQYKVDLEKGLMKRGNLFGEIDYVKEIITIDADLSDTRKLQTILHELTHGILNECGDEAHQNEEWVKKFSNTLTKVFIDDGWSFGEENERD